MANAVYEHHPYETPLLPFIYHRDIANRSDFATLHWHEHLEFLCGLQGTAQVGCSAQHYSLSAGDMVIINTNQPHSVAAETDAVYDCLIINAAFCRENGLDVDALFLSPYLHDPEAIRLHAAACAAFRETGSLRVLHTRTAVLLFLQYLCDRHAADSRPYAAAPSVAAIKAAVRYIRAHYAEPITLDDAAAAAGLSRYYFAREFRRVTGQSFVPFLNEVRCEQALPMLRRGLSVTEVCFACGFRELGYFSRTFRKITGQPPSALRNA